MQCKYFALLTFFRAKLIQTFHLAVYIVNEVCLKTELLNLLCFLTFFLCTKRVTENSWIYGALNTMIVIDSYFGI